MLSALASVGVSKSGALLKVSAPEDEPMLNLAVSALAGTAFSLYMLTWFS